MKGHISDPDYAFSKALDRKLFAGTSYEYDFGGDPAAIPSLTHEELIAFHSDYYHPSNATFFLYGDQDIDFYLDYINENCLNQFQPNSADTSVGLVPRMNAPLNISTSVPESQASADPTRTHTYAVSWLCSDVSSNPYESFCLQVLSHVLMSNHKSAMYKALITSQLGITYAPGNGYDIYTREGTFTIGVKGCKEDAIAQVEQAIQETLQTCAETGLDLELVDSAVHQIEIRNKTIKENFGLGIIASMVPYALHGDDPLVPIYINEYVERLQSDLEAGKPVFQDIIKKHLLNNQHHVKIQAKPDASFIPALNEEESRKLEVLDSTLDNEDRERLKVDADALVARQAEESNDDVLPTLKIKDISKTLETTPYTITSTVSGVPFYAFAQPTNGISYLRLKIDTRQLPEHLRKYVPLYVRLANDVGTKGKPHDDFDNIKDLRTLSGIGCTSFAFSPPWTLETHEEHMLISVAFLERNAENALDIMQEWFDDLVFSEHSHIKQNIKRSVNARSKGLMSSGHSAALSLATSGLSPAAGVWQPLQSLRHDFDLVRSMEDREDEVLGQLEQGLMEVHRYIKDKKKHSVCCHVTNVDTQIQTIRNRLEGIYSSWNSPTQTGSLVIQPFETKLYKDFYTLPMQVNFAAMAFRTVPYFTADYAPLTILADLLSSDYLHRQIREKEGAYGAGASHDPNRGTMTFYSYRDPNNLKTYDIYKQCIDAIQSDTITEELLDQSKLRTFQKIDSPTTPQNKGLGNWLYGITWDQRQITRERLLSVTPADVVEVADRYLSDTSRASKVVFGTDQVDREKLEEDGWKVEKPIDDSNN